MKSKLSSSNLNTGLTAAVMGNSLAKTGQYEVGASRVSYKLDTGKAGISKKCTNKTSIFHRTSTLVGKILNVINGSVKEEFDLEYTQHRPNNYLGYHRWNQ